MSNSQEKLRELVDHACRSLVSDCALLERAVQESLTRGKQAPMDEMLRLLDEMIKLGASVGFGEVSLRASTLQAALKSFAAESQRSNAEGEAQIHYLLDLLKSTVAQLNPESSRLYNADLQNPKQGPIFHRIFTR